MTPAIIIFFCLVLSAFFSGMEIAFISANRLRIELDKKQGLFSSKIINVFTKKPACYIATMLVGNNVVLVIYGIIMAQILEPFINNYISNVYYILIAQTTISTVIILVTAEFIPKVIFRLIPNVALNFFSIPVLVFYILFYPVSRLIIAISHVFLKRIVSRESINQHDMYVFGKVDLDHLVQEVNTDSSKAQDTDHEIKFFQNALDFSKVKIRDCMVPRTEIVALGENCSVDELRQRFIETGFSKILIFRDNVDNIIGYVSSKDLFKNPHSLKSKIIKSPVVPETMNANKLLKLLLQEHKSLAVVVDEFGGTSGMITIEDIIEEIFGEIEDEHDTVEYIEKVLSDNSFVFSGKIPINYLNKKYSLDLPENDEYETLAGYVFYKLGRIPELNEKFNVEKYSFKILRINNKRLEMIYIKLID